MAAGETYRKRVLPSLLSCQVWVDLVTSLGPQSHNLSLIFNGSDAKMDVVVVTGPRIIFFLNYLHGYCFSSMKLFLLIGKAHIPSAGYPTDMRRIATKKSGE